MNLTILSKSETPVNSSRPPKVTTFKFQLNKTNFRSIYSLRKGSNSVQGKFYIMLRATYIIRKLNVKLTEHLPSLFVWRLNIEVKYVLDKVANAFYKLAAKKFTIKFRSLENYK